MKSADKSMRACDIARALVKYRRVYDRTQHADALLKIAAAQRGIGRLVAAAHTYERYLEHPGADPDKRPEVEKKLAEIDREIGKLRVQAGEPGRVFVDGTEAGEGERVRARVDPGRHVVTLQRDGAIRGAIAVEVPAGEERVVDFGKPSAALPDPSPPETTATGDIAKSADALKKACKLLEAIDEYRAAQARAPDARSARRLGDTLHRAGRPAQAADAYEESARLQGPGKKARALRRLKRLRSQFDRVRVSPALPGARLLVDGRPVTLTKAGTVRVDPGPHAAVLEKDGKAHSAAHFTAVAGGQTEVTLQEIGSAAPPTPTSATPAPSGTGSPGLGASASPGQGGPAASSGGAGEAGSAAESEASAEAPADASVSTGRAPFRAEHEGHAGQLSLLLESNTDLRTGDTGPTAGIAFGISPLVEVSVVALTQRLKGARIAGALLPIPGPALKPYVRVGMPIFSEDGLQAGGHAALGLLWDFTPMTGVSADLGVEHFPSMPAPYYDTYVLVTLGVQVRTPP